MKSYDRILGVILVSMALIWIVANVVIFRSEPSESGRPYRVEAGRIALAMEEKGFESVDLSGCRYIVNVRKVEENFYDSPNDYLIRNVGGELYRFDYVCDSQGNQTKIFLMVNAVIGTMWLFLMLAMIWVRQKILRPFERLVNVPYELSKGNLIMPMEESRSRFFGRFVWGIDMLRENMEQQKMRELELQKEKKTLLLSISHDIKTPLSAIKLYAKALAKGLYSQEAKQIEIAESINLKADEIEGYVSQIITASREDFLSLEVDLGDFYLSELIGRVKVYYSEKLALVKTQFAVGAYSDCLLKGDLDRGVEVLQNLIENAVKYGDGKYIGIDFEREENCVLITVRNSGNSLPDNELPHMFDSFWRGQNAGRVQGSGLGLYICRQLMHKMDGEIFARIEGEDMLVTVVFVMAG